MTRFIRNTLAGGDAAPPPVSSTPPPVPSGPTAQPPRPDARTRALQLTTHHWPEAIAFVFVLTVAAVVRLVKLGQIPRILAGDETDTLQNAIRINRGTGPGLIGFDWSQSPILPIYPLAWIVRVFGDSIADFRLYPVIFSMLAIVCMYLAARVVVSAPAAIAAMLLLATNVWFLNFSRTLWYNMNGVFFAIGACWAVSRALRSETRAVWAWWVLTGLFVTGGLYGYATGRFICISVALAVIFAVITRLAPARQSLLGLALVAVMSAVLFAPMANYIQDNYEVFKRRADTVSVFEQTDPEGNKKDGWALVWNNIEPNYRGLVFNEGAQANRGPYNARYRPFNRAGLEIIGAHLFLIGVVVAAFRWRQTYTWFPFFLPVAIASVFSVDTPDYARAVLFAPFYFLFISLVFDEVLRRRWRFAPKPLVLVAIFALSAFIAVREVNLYFDWQDKTDTQIQRTPGIDRCEYNGWLELAHKAADNSALVNPEDLLRVRNELECSPIIRAKGEYD